MSRKKDELVRGRLLEAGRAVVAKRGVGRATVDEVTKRAGVAKGTFYLYFDSKATLVSALQEDFLRRIARAVEAAATGDEAVSEVMTWREQADELARVAVTSYLGIGPTYQEVIEHGPSAAGDGWEARITDSVSAFLAEANGAGKTAPETYRGQALFLFHGIDGLCHHALRDGMQTVDDLLPTIRRFLACVVPDER